MSVFRNSFKRIDGFFGFGATGGRACVTFWSSRRGVRSTQNYARTDLPLSFACRLKLFLLHLFCFPKVLLPVSSSERFFASLLVGFFFMEMIVRGAECERVARPLSFVNDLACFGFFFSPKNSSFCLVRRRRKLYGFLSAVQEVVGRLSLLSPHIFRHE